MYAVWSKEPEERSSVRLRVLTWKQTITLGGVSVAGEDLRKLQREAIAAISQQRARSPSGAPLVAGASQSLAGGSGNTVANRGEQYLVFSLREQEFAVKAELVQGVERLLDLTPVPNVAPWVKGVINLRGSITSVVDLRMFLDLEQLPYSSRTRLLTLQYNEMVICLVVDSVSEMHPIPASTINNGGRQATIPSWVLSYTTGSASLGSRMVVMLDVSRLLFSEKMQHYQIESVP
jgi:purine-binding chemotaxis protein CheW